MNHLGSDNIKYPMVFDQGLATHVVTGITYGAKAFFVFDRKHSDTSSKKKVHGQLHTMVKAIPSVQLEGEGNAKLDLSEAEQKKAASFECAFYGDFVPSINPTTYQEAVRLYKELPTQLGPNNEKAVPITVSLYPLEKLNSNASKLVRQISVQLINRTEKALENLHLFEVKCKDLLKSEVCRSFQSFQNEIEGLIGMNREYKTFQSKLLHILPKIRGGGAEDGELAAVLLDHEKSVLWAESSSGDGEKREWNESPEHESELPEWGRNSVKLHPFSRASRPQVHHCCVTYNQKATDRSSCSAATGLPQGWRNPEGCRPGGRGPCCGQLHGGQRQSFQGILPRKQKMKKDEENSANLSVYQNNKWV